MTTLGQRLRGIREKRGLTQAQLETRTGIGGAAISRYECDKQRPTLDTIYRLAKGLKVPPGELVDLDDLDEAI